jgi:hypothetical protein
MMNIFVVFVRDIIISKNGITRPLLSRSWLNLFSKLLLVNEVKPGALIGQKRVAKKFRRYWEPPLYWAPISQEVFCQIAKVFGKKFRQIRRYWAGEIGPPVINDQLKNYIF